MEPEEVRDLPAIVLSDALDRIGIEKGWATGDLVRARAATDPGAPCLPDPPERRPLGPFRNLVVGTLTERTFYERYLGPLEAQGFTVVDYHTRAEHRDFGIHRDGLELPLNVKVASTMFRKAREVVGLDPDDTIPISAYKAIGAVERVSSLVYVDLVDFTLRERVDAFMEQLGDHLGVGWALLGAYGGKGRRRAEDAYIEALFAERGDDLRGLVLESPQFRVISAQRVLAVMRDNPRRVPGLGVKAAGTGVITAEVNVHISVANETTQWEEVQELCVTEGIGAVLARITRRENRNVPAPTL